MLMSQPLSTSELALKTLTRVLIERVGGLEAAASCTRVKRSVLSGYQNPHQPHFMPLDILARLEEVAREAPITEELARRAGYALTQPSAAGHESVPQLVARLGQETAELHQAFAEGLADGELCPMDEAALELETSHVLRKATRLLAALQAKRAKRIEREISGAG